MLVTDLNSYSGFPCSKGVRSLQVWGVIIPLLILAWELMNLVFPFYTINSVLTEWFTSNSSGCEGKKYLFELLFYANICYTKDRWEQIAAPQLWWETPDFAETHLAKWQVFRSSPLFCIVSGWPVILKSLLLSKATLYQIVLISI